MTADNRVEMGIEKLVAIQKQIVSCRDCPNMVGPPVHGPAVLSKILLVGQAPGPHEAGKGRPFAHTAGQTLFRWFDEASGVSEELFRSRVYMAAVARCFPGKASGGGDRVPDASEIARCGKHLGREIEILRPELILAVGRIAIQEILGEKIFSKRSKLNEVVGQSFYVNYHGWKTEAIALPHPSGLSAWHKTEPGKTLLRQALDRLSRHPVWNATFEGD